MDCLVEGVPTYGEPVRMLCVREIFRFLPCRHLLAWRSIWHWLLPCDSKSICRLRARRALQVIIFSTTRILEDGILKVLFFVGTQSNSAGAEDSDRMLGMAGSLGSLGRRL